MARVVVDVVLKPEILDPQGQAILGALGRLGITGSTSVRQGKHFELEVEDDVDDDAIAKLADTLLANPVIEDFTIHRNATSQVTWAVSARIGVVTFPGRSCRHPPMQTTPSTPT